MRHNSQLFPDLFLLKTDTSGPKVESIGVLLKNLNYVIKFHYAQLTSFMSTWSISQPLKFKWAGATERLSYRSILFLYILLLVTLRRHSVSVYYQQGLHYFSGVDSINMATSRSQFIKQDSHLTHIEKYVVLRCVRYEWGEMSSDHTMPVRWVLAVEEIL